MDVDKYLENINGELNKHEVSNIWSEINKYFILDEIKNFAWKNIYSISLFYKLNVFCVGKSYISS